MNVKIDRNEGPLGTIEPANGKWKVVICKDGMPELLIASKLKLDNGEIVDGWIDAREVPKGVSFAEINESVFEGECNEDGTPLNQ